MAAKFAEIFIKLGLKKEGFDKEVKKTSTSFKDMGKSMLKTGAIIGGVAAGAVIAGIAVELILWKFPLSPWKWQYPFWRNST